MDCVRVTGMKRWGGIANPAFLLGITVCLGTSLAWAREPEPALVCQPDSGFWQSENGHDVLSGAICSYDQEERLYRIEFDGVQTKHAFSPTITPKPGTLRSLVSVGETLFYADDAHLYAVDNHSFRVTWTRPWAHAVSFHAGLHAQFASFLVSTSEEAGAAVDTLKIVTVDQGHVSECLSAPINLSEHLELIWQPDKIVSVARTRLTWWPRQGASFGAPVTIELSQPIQDASAYQVDEMGMLVIDRQRNRIHYYRFDTRTRIVAHINATASVRGLGGSRTRAMGVTSDLHMVRVVARLGNVLQNRYEAKYWRIKDDAPMILADGETLVLDGGDDHRSQSVNTSAVTWKRMALMEYQVPGKLALLKDKILTTRHEEGHSALIRWNVTTGTPVAHLPFSAFEALGRQGARARIERVTSVPTHDGYLVLELNRLTDKQPHLAFVILELSSMRLVPEGRIFETDARMHGLPASIRLHEGGFTIADPTERAAWFVFGDGVRRQRLGDVPAGRSEERLTAAEKWYGYCYDEDQCMIPAQLEAETKDDTAALRKDAWQPTLNQFLDHHPPIGAVFVAIFALIAMILITAWRNGLFATSQLSPEDEGDDSRSASSSTTFEILDDRNRRFVTERDRASFLTPNVFSQTWFRMLVSIVAGIGTATCTSLRFFSDDTPFIFFTWLVILALPVTAAVWVMISWSFWNRLFLFRFGRFVEGTWLNCAKPNQSIAYTADNHKTYVISRYQWKRVDFVPIVLYDPTRPAYSAQYTGAVAYALGEKLPHATPHRHARCFDLFRLVVMTLLLAACIASTQNFFKSTYPNPLSIKELNALSADPETFLTSCLAVCRGEMCSKQCQNRQMRLVYEAADYALVADPDMTPDVFLSNAHTTMMKAAEIIEDGTTSCSETARRLRAVNMLPESLGHAFWDVYGQKHVYDLSGIESRHQSLLKDIAYFQELCDETGKCAHDAQSCPPPPQCSGSAVRLKQQLCDFARELKIPAIEN